MNRITCPKSYVIQRFHCTCVLLLALPLTNLREGLCHFCDLPGATLHLRLESADQVEQPDHAAKQVTRLLGDHSQCQYKSVSVSQNQSVSVEISSGGLHTHILTWRLASCEERETMT